MTILTANVEITSRAAALRWAAEVAADRSAVVLDTETTGLGDDAEICDIAIVALDGTVLLDTLVHPWGVIPPEATAIHGIRQEDTLSSPTWPAVAERMTPILYGRRVIVYNAAFDAGIVRQCCRRWRLPRVPEFAVGWECAMQAYAAFHGERRFGGGFKWWKLGVAAERLGIELDGAHRALADAESCRRVVLAMAEMEVALRCRAE